LHPDQPRYQEIQQALADKGYFKGQVNGQWGGDSVDAMKHFQADQKLPDDGKISALGLTSLGLGPKHASPQ
jgi:peptidoglycan hydrolase-like protein with peptidoglycan-binding domain